MKFVDYRYFSPALVTPESHGIIPGDTIPSIQARRNLVLLTKLIQVKYLIFVFRFSKFWVKGVSNGISFQKEEYMKCMLDFLEENKARMEEYLLKVSKDPLDPNGEQVFMSYY